MTPLLLICLAVGAVLVGWFLAEWRATDREIQRLIRRIKIEEARSQGRRSMGR